MLSVILIFVVFQVVAWSFNTTTIYLLQEELLYWNYFSHILMIALSVGAIALTKKGFASAGFTLKNWRYDLSIAVICVISAAAFIPALIFPSLADNAPLNSVFAIAATLVALLVVSKERTANEKTSSSKKGMQLLALVPAFSVAAIVASINYGLIVSTAIFQFFFAGFGEEIMFRGYMQSRLNEGFGYSWKFAGVKFGPGLLIASILFGVLHLLNPLLNNPLQGQYTLAIWSGITSTFGGFLFGFVREKTGDVLAPSIAHGLVDLGQIVPLLL
jgi:membrane protease YdiL (CAAX protease family)